MENRANHADRDSREFVSPRALADAIGVSESSVKRWVDGGRIQAARTAGGHRRIAVAEAVRFIRQSAVELVKPEALGLLDLVRVERAERGEETETLYRLLTQGEGREVRGFLLSLFLEGRSPAWIVDGPLREAMARAGCLWLEGVDGIVFEHRATELALQGLNVVRAALPPPDRSALAVGGAVEGDPYVLPSLAVALVLEAQGFPAINLGPMTPVAALRHAAETLEAELVWASVSVAASPRTLSRELADLTDVLAERDAVLVLGGAAVDELDLPLAPHLYVGGSMAELEALVRGLRLAERAGGQPPPSVE